MTQALEQVKALFDEWAREGKTDDLEREHTYAAREALREVAVPPSPTILDAGCGSGYVTRALAKRLPSATVLGVDVSKEMVDLARDITPKEMFNAVFFEGTIFDESLNDERFDLIFSMEALYYMHPVADAIKRLAHLLKPGGQLVIVVDYYKENGASHGWPKKYGVEMELLSAQDYLDALKEAGLTDPMQRFIRYPEGEGHPEWKVTEGSLMVSAFKPIEFVTPEEILRETES